MGRPGKWCWCSQPGRRSHSTRGLEGADTDGIKPLSERSRMRKEGMMLGGTGGGPAIDLFSAFADDANKLVPGADSVGGTQVRWGRVGPHV